MVAVSSVPQEGSSSLAGTPFAVGVTEALASDDMRLQAMGTVLDMLTWLVPVHIATFYTVNEAGEKYACGPTVVKVSEAFPLTVDEVLSSYRKNYAARDPFAPCRLPDPNMTLATLRDVAGGTGYAREVAAELELLPAANMYFRDRVKIVAGISLVRRLRAPRLSACEIAMLHRCHGWFEFWYTLGTRHKAPVAPYALDHGLTRRERQVLAELAHGKSYEAIADELEISYATLKTHVKHIFRKLGARDRVEAMAQLLGAVTPPQSFKTKVAGSAPPGVDLPHAR